MAEMINYIDSGVSVAIYLGIHLQ